MTFAPRLRAEAATATGAAFLPDVERTTSTSPDFIWEQLMMSLPSISLCSAALVRNPGVWAMLMPGPHSGRQKQGAPAR